MVRKDLIKKCKKIVVKAGTRLLTNRESITSLVDGIATLKKENRKVLLVTSGAVGIGMKELGLAKRPKKLAEIQALAAIGQSKLMAIYDEECKKHQIKTAQLLLTAADLRSRQRFLNVMNCINALWDNDILPIVNENDSVSVDELKFGDNDILSAMLGTLTLADLTIILTTEVGLRQSNDGVLGDRISVVEKVTPEIMKMAQGTDNPELSIGGMNSKLLAAKLLNTAGKYLWIADGRSDKILEKIITGEDVGTLFMPTCKKLHSRKLWITFFSKCNGSIIVDNGAKNAVLNGGKSLLPSGVQEINGKFKRGDTIEILDINGNAFARGLINFDAEDCHKIQRCHSDELLKILGKVADEELVHRDNLALL